MSALVKIRAERDRMSAIERRIADFVLENAQLLRDYSSQHLANALGISQSSVVKFCQKLGFKGYPDLKFSIGEALVRADNGQATAGAEAAESDRKSTLAGSLWRRKSEAEEATRLINPPDAIDAVAAAIGHAGKVFIIGLGEDDIHARAFAQKLSLLGILAVHNFDPAHMTASMSVAGPGDVLLVFSEHGKQSALCQICRYFREQQGKVITVTRHTSNALRAHADIALLVSAHDERAHIEPLLYHSALQHLLDGVFVLLCEADDGRNARLQANLERLQPLLEP
ncbi:MurR/RpiR family transcriptional regulator [Cognatiluteimonas weifangensis]|uniref:MurR/RpiR family transcriptional regulator n=1 Tax=Cognatiluteimonas weifangensis TaxID=2303539 RepID=A0A372DMK8_9GAMM|nr:MurR/RpiR family transcriptional regulator [Luteimonas weifangensis]RFP60746.1 MurR/RpiR family transcriptional regulator [Luteimonas weifangensis]